MEMHTSAEPSSSLDQDMNPPGTARDHRGSTDNTQSIENAATQERGSVNVSSRFDTLLQQLKEAHSQEVAELQILLGKRRRFPSAQDAAPSCKLDSRSSQESTSSTFNSKEVAFQWHGKTFGTKNRNVARASTDTSRGQGSRVSEDGKLLPALRPAKPRVSFVPESACEAAVLDEVTPKPEVVPGEVTPQPRVSFVPPSLPSQVSVEGVRPPPDEPAPLPLSSPAASGGTDLCEDEAQTFEVDDEENMQIACRLSAELAQSVLNCKLERVGLPPELARNPLVKAALAHDRDCLLRLQEKRTVTAYKLAQIWNMPSHAQSICRSASQGNLQQVVRQQTLKEYSENKYLYGDAVSQFLVVPPNYGRRHFWDTLTAVALSYDIMALPVLLCFRPDQSTFQQVMELIIATIWSLDIVASFLTGFYDKQSDQMILSLRLIAQQYFKSWFVLDALLVAYDWVLILMEAGSSSSSSADSGESRSAQVGRSLRTLRIFRTVRLLRLLKLKRIMQEIHDRLPSESASIVFRILKILGCLILANHVVACMWYLIGSSKGQGVASWVEQNAMESQTLAYQYAVCLHWSLSQFTPAGMEIYPAFGCLAERMFSVVVILVAMVGFSSFVSILTASMAELRKLASDESHQFWMLRRFLNDWSVSEELALRIERYLDYAYAQNQRRVQLKDVQLLKLLSGPMRHELLHDMLAVHVKSHCFFDLCGPRTIIFAGALASMSVAKGDVVFHAGEQGAKMYFVCKGVLLYTLGEFDADHPDRARWSDKFHDIVEKRCAGEYVSEAPLWTLWSHLGDLEAIGECTLVVIKADEFQKCVSLTTSLISMVKAYAMAFVKELNAIGITDLTDLLDQVISSPDIMNEGGITEELLGHNSQPLDEATLERAKAWTFTSLLPSVSQGKRTSVAILNAP